MSWACIISMSTFDLQSLFALGRHQKQMQAATDKIDYQTQAKAKTNGRTDGKNKALKKISCLGTQKQAKSTCGVKRTSKPSKNQRRQSTLQTSMALLEGHPLSIKTTGWTT